MTNNTLQVFKAYRQGKIWHEGQTRKYTGLPYFNHCEDVHDTFVAFLKLDKTFKVDALVSSDIRSACYLHDTLEDCKEATPEKITELCGKNVTELVLELTNPSKGSTLSRAKRKQMDRDHLKNISTEAKIIKLIDRSCNLSDLSLCPDKEFIRLYCQESYLLLDALMGTNYLLYLNLSNIIADLLRSINNGSH